MVDKMTANIADLEAYFDVLFARLHEAPPRLVEAVSYSVKAGGKRLRPLMLLASFEACAADSADRPTALAAAAAIELIHTFSLVHDDLPAMDDDDLRRGRPTNHKVFGEALAILSGDAMMSLAFETLAMDAAPDLLGPLAVELARSTGPCGMIGGQVMDIAGENQRLSLDELKRIHALKTGALLAASCRCGALAARASAGQLERLDRYGRHVGLAFQIIDDVLDVTGTPDVLGKAAHKDAGRGKNTYPALLGVDGARAEARQQLALALDALAPFGPAGDTLAMLARRVIERNH